MNKGKNEIKLLPNTSHNKLWLCNMYSNKRNSDRITHSKKHYYQCFINGQYGVTKLSTSINKFIEATLVGYWMNNDNIYLCSGDKPFGYTVDDQDVCAIQTVGGLESLKHFADVKYDVVWQPPINLFDIHNNSFEFLCSDVQVLDRTIKQYGMFRVNENVTTEFNPLCAYQTESEMFNALVEFERNAGDTIFDLLIKDILDIESHDPQQLYSQLTVDEVNGLSEISKRKNHDR